MSDYLRKDVRARVRVEAANRCGYCLSPQHLVMATLQLEHIVPRAVGGSSDIDNIWLACPLCNAFKSDQTQHADPRTGRVVELFDPRKQRWADHFRWSRDGSRIIGRTACGRATVAALRLNNRTAVTVRRNWVAAGWHPPQD